MTDVKSVTDVKSDGLPSDGLTKISCIMLLYSRMDLSWITRIWVNDNYQGGSSSGKDMDVCQRQYGNY
jgi:hypothetical protein